MTPFDRSHLARPVALDAIVADVIILPSGNARFLLERTSSANRRGLPLGGPCRRKSPQKNGDREAERTGAD